MDKISNDKIKVDIVDFKNQKEELVSFMKDVEEPFVCGKEFLEETIFEILSIYE